MMQSVSASFVWRAAMCSMALCVAATTASADAATDRLLRRIAVERFELATDSHGVLVAQGAKGLPRGQWQISLWAGYEHKPLVLQSLSTGEEIAPLIKARVGGGLAVSYGITSRLAIAASVPFVLRQSQGDLSDALDMPTELTAQGIGDIALMPRATLLRQAQSGVDLGVIARVVLPSGRDDAYLASGKGALGATVALARTWQRLAAIVNVGYQTRPQQYIADLEINDEVFAKLGGRYAVADGARAAKLGAVLSMSTRARRLLTDGNANAMELLVGGEVPVGAHQRPPRWALQAIGGVGLGKGYGIPAWRAVLSARLTLGGEPQAATVHRADATDLEPSALLLDSDGDGIPDDDDRCPDQAEVFNGIDDQDGCPDTDDRDGDGVPDAFDLCLEETEAERAPGVAHDRFGCPFPPP